MAQLVRTVLCHLGHPTNHANGMLPEDTEMTERHDRVQAHPSKSPPSGVLPARRRMMKGVLCMHGVSLIVSVTSLLEVKR